MILHVFCAGVWAVTESQLGSWFVGTWGSPLSWFVGTWGLSLSEMRKQVKAIPGSSKASPKVNRRRQVRPSPVHVNSSQRGGILHGGGVRGSCNFEGSHRLQVTL